ncbi:transcriptional regulator, LysR family, partial [Sutterella parvirubra YIT 11816]
MPIPKGRKESILITVTLRQLQVFLAIAKTENVGTAAADLFMSKSAVSQALAELEAKLEVQLFDRNRGRIYLTVE